MIFNTLNVDFFQTIYKLRRRIALVVKN